MDFGEILRLERFALNRRQAGYAETLFAPCAGLQFDDLSHDRQLHVGNLVLSRLCGRNAAYSSG